MLWKILKGLRLLKEAREDFAITTRQAGESFVVRIMSRYVARVPEIEKYYQDLYTQLLRQGVAGIALEFGTVKCWLGLPQTGHEEAEQYQITLELTFKTAPEIPLKRAWHSRATIVPEEAINWLLVEELADAA